MNAKITFKVILLSALYAILLLLFAVLLNLGLGWLLDNVLFRLIDWFNGLNIFWKVVLLFFEGIIVLKIIIRIFKFISILSCYLIFSKLPESWFIVIFSTIIFLFNTWICLYGLWVLTPPFNFLIVLEFIFLAYFIISANRILLPWYIKDKVEREMRKREFEEMYGKYNKY